MELTFPTIEIEKSGDFKTQSFGFKESGVIATILRKKLYSNPILVICQEIMSNARDANREAGRPDEPIKVQAPSSFDLHLSIKDHGIGISPDRMSNVFLNYGSSTKRANNLQTGGFGIGAKTPFSYADTFQIVTTTEENGKRIKRTYSAYIDTSQMGEMALISQEETKENTGTEIKMLCERKDINAFCSAIARVSEFWNPRPKVGSNVVYPTTQITVDKGDWFIYGNIQIRSSSYGYGHVDQTFCLIDGIRYPLDVNAILSWIGNNRKNLQSRASAFLSSNIVLRFKTGQVHVAASREALDYVDATYNAIADSVDKATQELIKECETSIAAATSLKEAVEAFNKFKFRGLINDAKWKGIELENSYQIQQNIYYYTQNRGGGLRTDTAGSFSVDMTHTPGTTPGTKSVAYYIDEVFNDDAKVVKPNPSYDPTGVRTWGLYGQKELVSYKPPNRKKIKTLSDLHGLQGRWSSATFYILRFDNQAALDSVLNDFTNIINHIGFKWLKDVAETKIVSAKGTSIKLGSFRTIEKVGYNWKWEESKTITQATGGVYAVLKQGGCYIKCGSKEVDRATAVGLQKLLDKPIVAVGQRLADKLAKDSGWNLLEKELQTKFDENFNKVKLISGYFINTSLDSVLGTPLFNALLPTISSLGDKSPIKKLITGVMLSHDNNFKAAQNIFNTGYVTGTDPSSLLTNSVDAADIVEKYYPLLFVAAKTYTPSLLIASETIKDIQNYIIEKEKQYV